MSGSDPTGVIGRGIILVDSAQAAAIFREGIFVNNLPSQLMVTWWFVGLVVWRDC